ncbi:response regulator transcription factor [Clostridium oryzae]|uniref:Stage 0 sporulation protein A homolog n=1 Tax=Clostridium oryzae TaxID=1450648 RepID=A0A1V4ILD3_9CLOT|nr:response regulator transcription factor [Clostridium oryzae]OPJ60841.1 sensory transduction protein regX3 [Clostridium oryzae]
MGRILLLEDDEALALGIEYTLSDEGYEVTRCSSVKSAKETFDETKFDIALLDVMLPDGNGYDVCKYIRTTSKLPVIFLTACDEEVNVVLGLEIGGDDYITKPFRVKELISRIKAVLRRTEKTAYKKVSYRSKDILFDMDSMKVYLKQEEVELSAQEYKLLQIFMANPKKVMSREEILTKLSDGAAYFDTNTLSVYIKRIREKIEVDSSQPQYIKTLRGIGYEWVVEVEAVKE